jgi:hypothetical protein
MDTGPRLADLRGAIVVIVATFTGVTATAVLPTAIDVRLILVLHLVFAGGDSTGFANVVTHTADTVAAFGAAFAIETIIAVGSPTVLICFVAVLHVVLARGNGTGAVDGIANTTKAVSTLGTVEPVGAARALSAAAVEVCLQTILLSVVTGCRDAGQARAVTDATLTVVGDQAALTVSAVRAVRATAVLVGLVTVGHLVGAVGNSTGAGRRFTDSTFAVRADEAVVSVCAGGTGGTAAVVVRLSSIEEPVGTGRRHTD